MPRVSVIVATYNWSSVLPFSIGSILRQTFTDFEVLVVGDACTDDSERVVSALGDTRIRWVNLPVNTRHQSGPNNEGLRLARGEIIAYLGHDDLWFPHHLASLVGALDVTESDFAHSVGVNLGADGAMRWPTLPAPALGSFASPLCMIHRKRATDHLGGWRTYGDSTDPPDVELWRRALGAGCKFTFVPRLTGVKFPAVLRKDVYVTRPCHEQAAWLARMDSEPDLEATLLVDLLVANPPVMSAVSYRALVRHFAFHTAAMLKWRFLALLPGRYSIPGSVIDRARRFKGLRE